MLHGWFLLFAPRARKFLSDDKTSARRSRSQPLHRVWTSRPRAVHEGPAVELVRRVLVVSGTEKSHPIRRVLMRSRPAIEMVELEPSGRGASPALAIDEGAAAPVALVNSAPDRVGDVARGADAVFDGLLRLASDR